MSGNTPPKAAPFTGKVLKDKYRVLEQIGTGAMSTVYRAEAVEGGAPLAVKVLHDHVLRREGQRERFDREARALARLQHPRILRLEDHGLIDDVPYLVTEFLDGQALDALLQESLPPLERGLEIAAQVLEGLAYAHEQGAIHRDLKTENIYVCATDDGSVSVKLLDFGLVKFLDEGRWGSGRELTMTGDIFGSPAYMSPEQALGSPLDPRSDVYSMGVVLFEILTGRWPFMEDTQAKMMHAHVSVPPPRLTEVRSDIPFPAGLEALFTKALAKQKEHRFADAGAMLTALNKVRAGTPDEPREPVSGTSAATVLVHRPLLSRLGGWPRVAIAGGVGIGAGVVLGLLYRWIAG